LRHRQPKRARVAGAIAVALVAVLAGSLPPAGASGDAARPPGIPARAWLLLDASDGTRLAAHDAGGSLPMASTTKLMTAYLALQRLPPRKRLVAPPYHALPGESLLELRTGERISVRDLLYGLLLPSGNDAAVTLADGVAGSLPAFVREMNRTARRLGLRDTSYANPIGLDAPDNYSSPRDLAKLALRLRREPLFRRIVNTPRTTLRTGAHPRRIVNHNDLVRDVPWINGVKTGYTLDAGYVLIGSGTRKGVTLLSVVMGAPSIPARDRDTLELLRYGFSLYRREARVKRGERLAAPAVLGRDETLPLVARHTVRVTARNTQVVDVRVGAPQEVEGPIRRGLRLGTARVTLDGDVVGRTALLAKRSAPGPSRRSLLARVDDALPGPRAIVWAGAGAAGAIVIGIALALTRRRRG
jgi:D-alanyl-D-alanine carboxypeptidase (penicillin-binding protein 5/6)